MHRHPYPSSQQPHPHHWGYHPYHQPHHCPPPPPQRSMHHHPHPHHPHHPPPPPPHHPHHHHYSYDPRYAMHHHHHAAAPQPPPPTAAPAASKSAPHSVVVTQPQPHHTAQKTAHRTPFSVKVTPEMATPQVLATTPVTATPVVAHDTPTIVQKKGAPFKSPITMSFERMLGAAALLKSPQPKSPAAVVVNENKKPPKQIPVEVTKPDETVAPPEANVEDQPMEDTVEVEETDQSDAATQALSVLSELATKSKAPDARSKPPKSRKSRSKRKTLEDILAEPPVEHDENLDAKGVPAHKRRESQANRMSILTMEQAALLPESNPFRQLALNPHLRPKIVIQMAMRRDHITNPNSSAGTILFEGFFWRDYPQLEQVLYDSMPEYYKISSGSRQSKFQQAFNNRLVEQMRETASAAGLVFDQFFDDRNLRDRIRCFFKTHLQNAKKRLATLHKHPESVEHQSTLRVFLRCVEENITYEESISKEPYKNNKPQGLQGPAMPTRKKVCAKSHKNNQQANSTVQQPPKTVVEPKGVSTSTLPRPLQDTTLHSVAV